MSKRKICITFFSPKNKTSFVNGALEMLEEGMPDLMMWKRCNTMIKGWLATAMEKESRSSVKYYNNVIEIWEDLEERFGKESAPRAYKIKHTPT